MNEQRTDEGWERDGWGGGRLRHGRRGEGRREREDRDLRGETFDPKSAYRAIMDIILSLLGNCYLIVCQVYAIKMIGPASAL